MNVYYGGFRAGYVPSDHKHFFRYFFTLLAPAGEVGDLCFKCRDCGNRVFVPRSWYNGKVLRNGDLERTA